MPSLLAFLRSRVQSKPPNTAVTTPESHADAQVAPRATTESHTSDNHAETSIAPQAYAVDRRIVRDLAGFLETYSAEDAAQRGAGLRPPCRSSRKAVPTEAAPETNTNPESAASPSPPMGAFNEVPTHRPATSASRSSLTSESSPEAPLRSRASKRVMSRFSRQMSSVSTWATFGKNTDLGTPQPRSSAPPSAWNNHLGSAESLALRRSSSSKRRPQSKHGSTISDHLTGPSRTPSDAQPSRSAIRTSSLQLDDPDDVHDIHDFTTHHHNAPLDSIPRLHSSRSSCSPSHSRPRSCSRSRSTRSRSQSLYHSASTTPSNLILASPYTFGAPSPPALDDGGSRFESVTPPPPLPPLQHPELLSALPSRPRVNVSDTLSDTHRIFTPVWSTVLYANTYPRRSHGKTTSDVRMTASTPTLTGSKVDRHRSASLSRVFRMASTDRLWRGSSAHASSQSPRRRISAEWCAAQATAGVTALLPSDFGWPAEVAERLVKLSLSQETGETKDTRGIDELKSDNRCAGDAEPRATQAGEQRESPSCSCPSRLIPTSRSSFFQSPPAQEAAEGLGSSHHSLHPMDSPHSNRPQSLSQDDSTLPMNYSATDTLKRSSSASVHEDRVDKGRSKRVHHRSNPSPVASSSRPKDLSRSSSSSTTAIRTTPRSALRMTRSRSESGLHSVPETPPNGKGKRKAEELDTTPPDQKAEHHATFVIPVEARRSHRSSEVSKAPSSYHRKRARLSTTTPQGSPSRSWSTTAQQQAQHTPDHHASWSRRSAQINLLRSGSRASRAQSTVSGRPAESVSRRSLDVSERSIPISALITPHAPSVARSSQYHMRDPRRPPRVRATEWSPHLGSDDEDASPPHAWFFFVGFILFPIWWLASFWPIPKTRQVGGTDAEKAVTLDDPQVEHDARTWRNRCRIMSGISFLTYIPFIILVAILVPRHV